MWNFDGVACAAALELGNPVYYFHADHLLYGFVGMLFWKGFSFFGLHRALPALQLLTTFLSVGGLVGLYYLLEFILADGGAALLTTLWVGVTAVVWVWSLEAQVYALGFLAIAWTTWKLIQPGAAKKWLWVGFGQALAVLGHVLHILWVVPALYWLSAETLPPQAKRFRNLYHYLGALALGVGIPYLLVLGLVIIPHHPYWLWVKTWLLGSAALTLDRTFQWHAAGWVGPWLWAKTTLRFFWGSFWPYAQTPISRSDQLLTATSGLGVLTLLGLSLRRRHQTLWVFSLLWLLAYGAFLSTWEPLTECYRMSDAVPIALLAALGLQSLNQRKVRWGLLGLLGATTLIVNLGTRIRPMNQADNNTAYTEITKLTRATPEQSLYLTPGGLSYIYLLYFAGRSAWNLPFVSAHNPSWKSEVARHHRFEPVYIQCSAIGEATQPWTSSYQLVPVGQNLPWMRLQ
jgi:hypothetical protein